MSRLWRRLDSIRRPVYLVDKTHLFRIGLTSAVQGACSLLGSMTATDQLGIWCRWGPMGGTAFSLCRRWPARGIMSARLLVLLCTLTGQWPVMCTLMYKLWLPSTDRVRCAWFLSRSWLPRLFHSITFKVDETGATVFDIIFSWLSLILIYLILINNCKHIIFSSEILKEREYNFIYMNQSINVINRLLLPYSIVLLLHRIYLVNMYERSSKNVVFSTTVYNKW